MIDLHIHTNKSDGEFSPKEIVNKAKENKLSVIAITDHDTCDGVEEAIKEGEKIGIKVIPGIEITAFDKEEIHILGYNIDYNSYILAFYKIYVKFKLKQEEKNIFKTFKKMNINIDKRELRKKAANKFLVPTDYDRWLVENGYEKDIKEAFQKYFINGMLKYRKKDRMSINSAIKLITLLGGIPVLAHPCRISYEWVDIENLISKLSKKGLKGLEVYYSNSTVEQVSKFKEIAKKYDLIQTLGSDYHGPRINKIEMGHGIDNNLDTHNKIESPV